MWCGYNRGSAQGHRIVARPQDAECLRAAATTVPSRGQSNLFALSILVFGSSCVVQDQEAVLLVHQVIVLTILQATQVRRTAHQTWLLFRRVIFVTLACRLPGCYESGKNNRQRSRESCT